MIVGVDHVGWAVTDLERAGADLEGFGYVCDFVVTGVPNAPAKRPYLNEFRPAHDLALYRSADGSPGIELVRHGPRLHQRHGDALPTILLDGPAGTSRAPAHLGAAISAAWGGPEVGLSRFGSTGPETVTAAVGGPSRVLAYVVGTRSLEAALLLWSAGLGLAIFRADRAAGWARMRSASPVSAWRADVILVEDPMRETHVRRLDEGAFTNIALISTSIDDDRERAARLAGREWSDVFEIVLRGRRLRACVGATPDGDVVELIEISRGDRP